MFQGWGKKTNYFEGWYFKNISADCRHALAIIPGISLADQDKHAFIQIMDGVAKTSNYLRFDLNEFKTQTDGFEVSIGTNRFALTYLELDLPELSGRLQWTEPAEFKGRFWSPGIMGWYSFMPFMQCYHGLVSAHHQLSGQLNYRGQMINFSGGKGYVEKDWGSSFPLAWVWTQCNHYTGYDDLSIMASVAHIPWLGNYFIGFLAIVHFRGEIRIFTTYTRAEMNLKLNEDEVRLTFTDKRSSLDIIARQAEGTDLIAPQKGAMTGKVNESLQARHEVIYRHQGEVIKTTGRMAGLEVGGNSRILLAQN